MRLISLILLLAVPSIAKAGALNDQHSLGFTLSNISGYGVYYDLVRTDQYVLRPIGLVYYLDLSRQGRSEVNYNYTAGFEAQKMIVRKKNRTFSFIAGTYFYHDETQVKTPDQSGAEKTALNSISCGAGISFEHSLDRMLLSFQIGLKTFWDEARREGEGVTESTERIIKLKEGGGFSVGFLL